MNKREKVLTTLLGAIVVELAVLDYTAWMLLQNGIEMTVTQEELVEAGEQAMQDMEGE